MGPRAHVLWHGQDAGLAGTSIRMRLRGKILAHFSPAMSGVGLLGGHTANTSGHHQPGKEVCLHLQATGNRPNTSTRSRPHTTSQRTYRITQTETCGEHQQYKRRSGAVHNPHNRQAMHRHPSTGPIHTLHWCRSTRTRQQQSTQASDCLYMLVRVTAHELAHT